ncbi:MAG: hypothetical protein Q8P76_03085 [bacterium]|nr:hypothetical protein [bacterium]
MAKKVFTSGMVIGAKLMELLTNAVIDAGGTEEDVRRLETNGGLRKKVGELIAGVKQSANGVLRLAVDYSQSLSDTIKACEFDRINSDITEKHFPINKRPNGEVDTKMFHFNRPITSGQAIQEMDKEGYRPAELPELLAYAKNNPDEQRKYPIVALGSVWRFFDGGRDVPFLFGVGDKRGLYLLWCGREWDEDSRFLAVRK